MSKKWPMPALIRWVERQGLDPNRICPIDMEFGNGWFEYEAWSPELNRRVGRRRAENVSTVRHYPEQFPWLEEWGPDFSA